MVGSAAPAIALQQFRLYVMHESSRPVASACIPCSCRPACMAWQQICKKKRSTWTGQHDFQHCKTCRSCLPYPTNKAVEVTSRPTRPTVLHQHAASHEVPADTPDVVDPANVEQRQLCQLGTVAMSCLLNALTGSFPNLRVLSFCRTTGRPLP